MRSGGRTSRSLVPSKASVAQNGGNKASVAQNGRSKASVAQNGENTDSTVSLHPPRGLEADVVRIAGEELLVLRVPRVARVEAPALTSAERAVAELALRGLSNAQIARARSTSARTVANQLASLFRKLGVGSRAELARSVVPP